MTTVRRTGRLLRAEWTKLWTVRRWTLALLASLVLSVLVALLAANGNKSQANADTDMVVGPRGLAVLDNFQFVHKPLDGDGSILARVASQDADQEWAAAGVMVKTSTAPGSSYAALMLTPGHGVRVGANFDTDIDGGAGPSPVWLRLTRAGTEVTASRSSDGATWRTVATVRLVAPSTTVQVGMFVSAPPKLSVRKTLSGVEGGYSRTTGRATFDHVQVTGAARGDWVGETIGQDARVKSDDPDPSASTEAGGVFTVTGSGTIGPSEPLDDPVQNSLFGLFFGALVLIPVAVLFMTSEYRRPLILVTFGANPRRRCVLAAKAVVVGAASSATGLAAALVIYLVTRPVSEANGYRPPAFAYTSLAQPAVLRAVLGSAVLVGALGVLAFAVAALVRHSAAAISVFIALFVLPVFVAAPLSLTAARWLMMLTPAGGLAIQRTMPPTSTLPEPWSSISPWLGLGVACAYAALALALAIWRIQRRDA